MIFIEKIKTGEIKVALAFPDLPLEFLGKLVKFARYVDIRIFEKYRNKNSSKSSNIKDNQIGAM